MGNEISRIEREFIIKSLEDKKIPVHVHGNKKENEGLIINYNEDVIEITSEETSWENYREDEKARVFFSYYENVMTFETKILKIKENLFIKYPDCLYRNLQRKYERVSTPEKVKISFSLEEKVIELNYPKTEEYDPVEEPELSDDFDPGNIKDLIENFKEKLDLVTSENKIEMFREKKPVSFEEKLISVTGCILYIPSTDKDFPDDDLYLGGRIIIKSMFPKEDEMDDNILLGFNQEELPEYLEKKKEKGIISEIYCPILYHEYALGYIYLVTKEDMDETINSDTLDYVYQFSRVLAYSLKINGYFKEGELAVKEYLTDIIDISASGLLFGHFSESLSSSVMLYTDIEIILYLGDKKIPIESRIMRKYRDKKNTYYGVQFLEIKPEDFSFLFDFVYGRKHSDQDETKWEGGAPPPDLTFS